MILVIDESSFRDITPEDNSVHIYINESDEYGRPYKIAIKAEFVLSLCTKLIAASEQILKSPEQREKEKGQEKIQLLYREAMESENIEFIEKTIALLQFNQYTGAASMLNLRLEKLKK